MKLLQKLETVATTSKAGNLRYRRQGLFLCPRCKESVTRPLDNGERSDTCGSAGCRETTKETHGYAGKKLYIIWNNIRLRCNNPNNTAYKYYGAKGIKHPVSWNTFEGFFLDIGFSYREGMSIDRLDNTKDYSKENCQWIPHTENCAKEKQKEVGKYTLEGVFLVRYSSVQSAVDAEGYKFNSSISKVARGERKQYLGYVWKYI